MHSSGLHPMRFYFLSNFLTADFILGSAVPAFTRDRSVTLKKRRTHRLASTVLLRLSLDLNNAWEMHFPPFS